MATTNPLLYIDYDYDNIKQDLINRLKTAGAWLDTYESSTGIMIIELFAYFLQLNQYYIERRAEECYLGTAQNKSSAVNLVRLINYSPKRKISAVGTLRFSVASPAIKRIFIPQYTKCQTSGGVEFVTTQDVTIEPGQTYNEIQAIQGSLVVLEYTGDGSTDQEYQISDTSVENDDHLELSPFYAFRVLVDGEEWTRVTSFLSSDNTDTHYKLRMELDDTLTVIFGDDVRGKTPGSGSAIQIKYIRSDGSDGNVYQTGKVTTLSDTLYDEDGNAVTVIVTNSTTMTGGDDAETKDEIVDEAPGVFATGDRAVTKADFRSLIINYGSVADVNVWGENEESPPNYDMFNRVKLCILLDGWYLLSASFKTNLTAYLQDYSTLTVKYEYIDATILYVIPVLNVIVNRGYSLSQTQSDIETALAAQFVLGNTSKLGTSKRLSNLIDAVDSLAGVNYHSMILQIRKDLTAGYVSGYGFGTTLDAVPILTQSVEIYVGDTQVAVDNGSGEFIDLSSEYEVSGTIDYTTGVLYVDILPTPTDEIVSVRYRQDQSGDIVVTNNQVCKLYDVSFELIGYGS